VGVAAAVTGLVLITVAALLGTFNTSTTPVPGPVRPAAGPSPEQPAHGSWVSMPAAPFRLCDPVAVWDGRGLVVVEPGVRVNGWCPARAVASMVPSDGGEQHDREMRHGITTARTSWR